MNVRSHEAMFISDAFHLCLKKAIINKSKNENLKHIKMKKLIKSAINLIILVFLSYSAHSQYFGQNKVNYEVFDFKIYETPNFKIYHYIEDEEKVENFAQLCERWYKRHQAIFRDTLKKHPNSKKDIEVLGPVEAPIAKIKGKYRQQILIKSRRPAYLNQLLGEIDRFSPQILGPSGVRLIMDVDPYQMI